MGQSLSRQFGKEEDGALYPAPFAFTMGGKLMCSSSFKDMGKKEKNGKKILILASGESRLKLNNGTVFSTGHNPTEIFVPVYHFIQSGYDVEIATPDAKPVVIEHWALPACKLGGYDKEVNAMMTELKQQLEHPTDAAAINKDLDGYAGIFVPGGHGPMINMHEVKVVGDLLLAAHKKGLPTASICHGPNALRATKLAQGPDEEFPYKGYKVCVFPDKADNMAWLRYLPGTMPQMCESELRALGMQIQNKEMDDKVVVDRELVTGSSQRAAQKLAVAFLELLEKPI